MKRIGLSSSHAESNVPGVSGPDAVGNEDGAGNTVVVEVVKVLVLRNGRTLEAIIACTFRIIGGALESGDAR
jgi:hypothetical protein